MNPTKSASAQPGYASTFWFAKDEASGLSGKFYLILGLALAVFVLFGNHSTTNAKVPYAFRFFKYGPRLLTGTYYSYNAQKLIEQGYRKFQQQAFKMVRGDVNMMFIPPSAVDEVSSLPPEVASNLGALGFDLVGLFAALGMPSTSSNRLHYRVVQTKVTQNLAASRASLEDEIAQAVADYFPADGEWARIQPYWVLSKIVSRASSRVLVGKPWCHDQNWLDFQINFVENTLISSIQMRNFPTWTWPVLKYLLPSCRNLANDVRGAHNILDPAFARQLKERDEGTWKQTNDEPNGTDWLCEIAEGTERNPAVLTGCQVILTLASVHTSSFNAINTLYDVMQHPEHIDLLRAELASTAASSASARAEATDLPKLDSVLRESQRFSPPSIIGLRRVMQQDVVLADGTFLPKGAYICAGTQAIQHIATPDADRYDGLRSFDARGSRTSSSSSKGLFTSPERTALTWGLGKTACPGRWFAGVLLKTLFAKLLTEYDFAFPPGRDSRPVNSLGHEFLMPERDAEILVRRRVAAT